MKSLKNHFSVIFPLIVLLFSLQFTFALEKIVTQYEQKLTQDYSIIIVSSKELDEKSIKKDISDFSSLEPMSTKSMLDNLKDDITSKNLSLLKIALPKFYSLKLTKFPDKKRLLSIQKRLKMYSHITKVEVFAKTHDKIYKIFVIAKSFAYIFTVLIFIISLLLMLKQMRIWVLEHKERMDIMTLFGAPFWMQSASLYRLAIVDSILATLIVVGFFYFIPNAQFMQNFTSNLDLAAPKISFLAEGGILLLVALCFSLTSVSLVMIRVKKD